MSASLNDTLSGIFSGLVNVHNNFINYDEILSGALADIDILNGIAEIDLNELSNDLILNAKIWAEGTDEQVQAIGGQHSAKRYYEMITEYYQQITGYIQLASALNDALSSYNADNTQY